MAGFRLILTSCALVALQAGQPSTPRRIVPVDEAPQNASFREFRDLLLQATRERNLKRVMAMTSADVRVTKGSGLAGLRREWNMDRSVEPFLRELETILTLGGRFSQSSCTFVAPFVWTEFPESLYDVDYVVAMQDRAPIVAKPGAGDAIAFAMTGDLLRYDLGERNWVHVTTVDGKQGYIARSLVRKPNSYRAYFTKIMDEEWKLVGFLQGVG